MAESAGLRARQLRKRDVVRLSRNTYLPRHMADDVRARTDAVLLTAPDGAVVSHLTAATMWGIPIPLRPDDERIHLVVSTGSAVRGRADRAVHRMPIPAAETVRLRGILVTTPARTWRDLAAMLERPALLAVTDWLIGRHCTPADLTAQLRLRPSGRGAARARDVAPLGDPRTESPMESWSRWLFHEAGLPEPELQGRIVDPMGRFLARADFVWREQKVLVEFDGDHHRDRPTFVDDVRRQNALVAAGWTILRFTSADVVGRPTYVVATIRNALR